jgi:hypothetical protein
MSAVSIIVTSYGEKGFPWLAQLREGNPHAEIHLAPDLRSGAKVELWRNADRHLRAWWRECRSVVKGEVVWVLEYDVMVIGELPPFHGAGLAGKDAAPPVDWEWWSERVRLGALSQRAQGLAPLGVLVMRRAVLDAIASPEWAPWFAADIFCELRFATIAAASGFPVETIELPKVEWHRVPKPSPGQTGIYHSVKP